uniref:Predicted protein n=1 Tax=Hordeum vulgare subsp. vulgare TaxID=112509 RepID=F2DJK0_HORVV|nr:predicted protein [Hordeum vulgare subsp. vulgare]
MMEPAGIRRWRPLWHLGSAGLSRRSYIDVSRGQSALELILLLSLRGQKRVESGESRHTRRGGKADENHHRHNACECHGRKRRRRRRRQHDPSLWRF